jgi:hypothetical protein
MGKQNEITLGMHELMGHILLLVKRIWGPKEWGDSNLKIYPFQI